MACVTFASTNTTDIGYIEEADCGVTPDTPAFQLLPTTGGSPNGNTTTSQSEVIRADRMTDDLVVTDQEITGSLNYELSYGPYKPLMQALLLDSAPVTLPAVSETIDVVAATGVVTGTATTFITDGIKVGMFVKISSVLDSTQDGVYKVLSVASETEFTIPNLASGKGMTADLSQTDVVISGTFYRNGAEAPNNYSIMKRIQNAGTTSYFYYRGCQISQMTFNFATGAILAGSLDVVGLSEEATTIEIAGSTYDAVASYALMNSVSSVTAIDLGGASASTEFSDMSISVNNNINQAKAIGTLGAAALAAFTLDITSDSTVYFEDTALYNQYLAATAFYVDITLQDGDGNILVISMPKAKFESLDAPIDGRDNFMLQNGTLRALRDASIPTESYMIQFSFIDAA